MTRLSPEETSKLLGYLSLFGEVMIQDIGLFTVMATVVSQNCDQEIDPSTFENEYCVEFREFDTPQQLVSKYFFVGGLLMLVCFPEEGYQTPSDQDEKDSYLKLRLIKEMLDAY